MAGKKKKPDGDDQPPKKRKPDKPHDYPEECIPPHLRRRRVAEMLLTGVTAYTQMAVALNTSEAVIRNDVRAIRTTWLKEEPKKHREKVITRVRQLERVVALASNEFLRSQQDKIETTLEPCPNEGCFHGLIRQEDGSNKQCNECNGDGFVKTATKVVKRDGNPAFLHIIKDTLVEISRLEGIHPATVTALRKTAREMLPDGSVKETVAELFAYADAPVDIIIDGLTQIDIVKERLANSKKLVLENSRGGTGGNSGIEITGQDQQSAG